MDAILILDTSILIDLEHGKIHRDAFPNVELKIAAISVAEYRTGIELNSDTRRARSMEQTLSAILEVCTVLDYTERTAEHHARLLAECRRSGRIRGNHDLIIAAHAAETGDTILSRDAAARFSGLTGVRAASPADL